MPQKPEKRTRDEILSDAFELFNNELSDVGKKAVNKVIDRLSKNGCIIFA